MASPDQNEPSLEELSLTPLEGEQVATEAQTTNRPKLNTRHCSDRRTADERRNEIRFQTPRREGKNRRPNNPWSPGADV